MKNRLFYQTDNFGVFIDTELPVLVIELGESEPFDEEETAAAEEDERNSMTPIT